MSCCQTLRAKEKKMPLKEFLLQFLMNAELSKEFGTVIWWTDSDNGLASIKLPDGRRDRGDASTRLTKAWNIINGRKPTNCKSTFKEALKASPIFQQKNGDIFMLDFNGRNRTSFIAIEEQSPSTSSVAGPSSTPDDMEDFRVNNPHLPDDTGILLNGIRVAEQNRNDGTINETNAENRSTVSDDTCSSNHRCQIASDTTESDENLNHILLNNPDAPMDFSFLEEEEMLIIIAENPGLEDSI